MDLLIEKDGQSQKLSGLGLYNITVEDSSPAVELSRRTVKGRNGYIFDGLTYTEKKISVTARLSAGSMEDFLNKKDELTRWVLGDDSFYITKLYQNVNNIYDFQTPGQTTGDLNLAQLPHNNWKYRYNVVGDGQIEFDFIGNSEAGIKYNVSFSFVTAELPYGETIPRDLALSANSFPYNGTAPLSQLEVPFIVELTANADNTDFFLEIDGRRFTYRHMETPLRSGQKLLLKGVETAIYQGPTTQDLNVNNRTNYEYFVIRPKPNRSINWFTNFKGTVKILGFKELYR